MYAYNYVFVYSSGYNSSGNIIFNEIIITDFDPAQLKYKGEQISYNAKISLTYNANYAFYEYD